jgi:NDP-sugar pyrophosphorylase family protein
LEGKVYGKDSVSLYKSRSIFCDWICIKTVKDKYRITLIYNDGTEEYSEVKIRSAQHKCTVSHWANKNVVTADIKVSKNSLGTVDVKVNDKKLVEESKKFNPCIIGAPVEVPAGYHLGFSASTGRGSGTENNV